MAGLRFKKDLLHWRQVSEDLPNRFAMLLLGWTTLLWLAWFALHYDIERLYADGAYFLTQVISKEGFHVINGRWLIPLTQWMPLAGVRLGLPMGTLITLYSLGNVVIAAAGWIFLTTRLRDPDAGITLLATQFVGLTHALFCPIFEFHVGAMLLVVFRAVLRTGRLVGTVRIVTLSILFVLVISSHFMGLLAMLLVLALERIWLQRGWMIWFSLLLVLQQVHRFSTLSDYEGQAFANVFYRLDQWGWWWVFAPGRLWGQWLHALAHYPDTLLLAIILTAVLIRSRDVRTLAIFLGGLLVMYILISLYFPDGTHDRYREILDYTPTVWVLLVTGARILPIASLRPVITAVLAVVLIYRAAWSGEVGKAYTARVEWTKERMDAARAQGIRRGVDLSRRMFVPPGYNTAALAKLSATEVLLLSARDGPDSVLVLVPLIEAELRPGFSAWLDVKLRQFGTELPTDPNGTYFHMPKEEFRVLR